MSRPSRASSGDDARELVARQDRVDAGRRAASAPGCEAGPEHPLLAPLVERLQKDRRLLRFAIDHRNRARLDDAGEVEKLVVLAERLFARPFGRPLQDCDAVADRSAILARRAANSSRGKISAPVNTGCAEGDRHNASQTTATSPRAAV